MRAEVLNVIGVSPFSPQHDRLVQRLAAVRAALCSSSDSYPRASVGNKRAEGAWSWTEDCRITHTGLDGGTRRGECNQRQYSVRISAGIVVDHVVGDEHCLFYLFIPYVDHRLLSTCAVFATIARSPLNELRKGLPW